jgi:GNAT superfamily N-acetyltransferase
VGLTEQHATGLDYLETVTDLLQRIRLATPDGGVWEAADMQWAWRKDQHRDPAMATFWIDDSGRAVGGAVIMDWGEFVGCELLVHPKVGDLLPTMWSTTVDTLTRLRSRVIEMSLRDDDPVGISLASEAGFVAVGATYVSCWLDAANRPAVTQLAGGYTLYSRADAPDRPHHMIRRNGTHVERYLRDCSLYDPSLDLFVEAPDGSVAAYGLFWPDAITGVGLVEPMRTEDAHQGHGLARHILTAGVDGLARAGCERIKITYVDDNPVSEHVYLSTGFRPGDNARTYRRPATH